MTAFDRNPPYEAPLKPVRRWDYNHFDREFDDRNRLVKAWNRYGQCVYMAQSNSSREASHRFIGSGRARPTFIRSGQAPVRQAS